MQQPDTYVAPARYPLTVLHRPDPFADDPLQGRTRCGREMLPEELWRPVDGRDGDELCTGCMLPGAPETPDEDTAGYVQEAML